MVRYALFIAVVMTLGVTGGTPLPSSKAEQDDEQDLLWIRTLMGGRRETCHSFECPGGSILMDSPRREECRNRGCSETQCCDKVCSSYDCHKMYSSVADSATTVCDRSGCTRKHCCEQDMIDCDSFKCSDGHAPTSNAKGIMCEDHEGTESQCCNEVCSSFDCPKGRSPVRNSDTTLCEESGCTTRLCCEPETTFCDSIACPDRFSSVDNVDEIECTWNECKESQCCYLDCSTFMCPRHSILKKGPFAAVQTKCDVNGCDAETCCVFLNYESHSYVSCWYRY